MYGDYTDCTLYTLHHYRPIPTWMRVYSWHMVIVGTGGGILSFVNAVLNVKDALSQGESCWTTMF